MVVFSRTPSTTGFRNKQTKNYRSPGGEGGEEDINIQTYFTESVVIHFFHTVAVPPLV